MTVTEKNQKCQRKNCLSATLSTKNPTWINLDANSGLCGEKPVKNRMSKQIIIKIFYNGFAWKYQV
jgi:hypothetical protein